MIIKINQTLSHQNFQRNIDNILQYHSPKYIKKDPTVYLQLYYLPISILFTCMTFFS